MDLTGLSVLVAGGGIGGLAAALALRARGADVRVLERAGAISEVGAGLQISPNGVAVLRALGLEEGLAAQAPRARAVSLRDPRGAEVLRLDLAAGKAGRGFYLAHRADLIALLEQAARARGVTIRLAARVTEVTDGARPVAVLEGGEELSADLVLGADGLHSVVRRALNGTAAPFFTGQAAWRAIVPNLVEHPPEARVHMGPGRHLVSYPLRGGQIVNLVAVEERRDWVAEGWHHRDDPEAPRRAFEGMGGDVPLLLAAVTEVHLWGLFRHPVAPRWHGQAMALLGDAAHPTLPFLAQGANMALEDAWVLARALAEAPGLPEGLATYQRLRRERTARIVAAASRNARHYHLHPPFAQGAHLALRMAGRLAPGAMLGRFDWIYGHDVTG